MHRTVVLLALAVVLTDTAPASAAPVPVLVIDGKGHGHGVGMAQDGALAMGKAGSSTPQILSQFYPGTTLGRSSGEVRVSVLTSSANSVVVRFPAGGEVRDARDGAQSPGFPVRVAAGGQARLRWDVGQFVVETAPGGTAAPALGRTGVGGTAAASGGTGAGGTAAASGGTGAGGTAAASGGTGAGGTAAASGGTGAGGTAAGAGGISGGNGSVVAAGADPGTGPEVTMAQAPPTTAPATTTTTAAPILGLLPPGKPLLPLPTGPLLPLPAVPLLTTTTAPPVTSAPPVTVAGRVASSRSLWAVPAGGATVDVAERGARYRGAIQAVGGGPLRLVNHVDVEQYLRGMGEVRNPSWPAASLRAQAIAARTYALRAMAGGGELCDTQLCQVYLGAQAEYAAMDKAVAATRGQVVLFRKTLAATVYSANGGGFSASTEEGFGTTGAGYPYLRPATYATTDPGPWTVTVSLRDVAARVGLRGKVTAVRTQAGPSGRVVQVTVEGQSGARSVSGIDFDRALGLRSTMFTVRLAESATAPPPPPTDGIAAQGLPGDPTPLPTGPAPTPEQATGTLAAAPPAGPAAVSAPAAPTTSSKFALGALAALLLALVASGATATGVGGGRPPARPRPRPPAATTPDA